MVEKDLEFEAHCIDILEGEQFEPDYLKNTPLTYGSKIWPDARQILDIESN